MLHKGLLSQILRRKYTFHLATFVLRSAWANRHNSSQGCNLDKLINQPELTRGLASHTRIQGHRKACLSLRHMSSRLEIALFRQERAMCPKRARVSLSKKRFGITKWWESIRSSCAFKLADGIGESTRWFKSQRWLQVYAKDIQASRIYHSRRDPSCEKQSRI
jgi:hypothetical protein